MSRNLRHQSRMLAVILSLALAAGSASPAFAAEKKTATDSNLSKEETVYVMSDENGGADKIIVSEWLKNTGQLSLVKDYTELKQIENVKGDEPFVEKDGKGTWKAEGKDIYYQGEIKKELPVEMKVSYYLDGKEISPKELAGKSGKVKMRFDYTNNQKLHGVYVPFVVMTGMSLDNDKFSNVEVTNGKVINDGQKSMIVGYALPGLSQSLKLEDADVSIPDYVEVTCQTEKFSLDGTMSVATSSLLSDLDLGDIEQMDDLKAALGELQSAAAQLQDGSEKLQSGAGDLAKGTGDLSKGSGTLSKGTKDLYKGTKTLKEKVAQLGDGLAAAKDGSAQLKEGAAKLQAGAGDLETGAVQLKGGIGQIPDKLQEAVGRVTAGIQGTQSRTGTIQADQTALKALNAIDASRLSDDEKTALAQAKGAIEKSIDGQKQIASSLASESAGMKDSVAELQAGADKLVKGTKDLESGLTDLSGGAKDLNTGITQACEGAGLLESGAGDLKKGAGQVNDGASALNAGARKVNDGAGTLATGARDLTSGIAKFKSDGVDKLVKAFDGDVSKVVDRLKALQDAAADYQSFAGKKAEIEGTVKFIYKTDEIE